MKEKILSFRQLNTKIADLRSAKKSIVLIAGNYDILHVGHISALKKAAAAGDVLIVGIRSDGSFRRYKNKNGPITPLEDRMEVLSELSVVDYIVPFEEKNPETLIEVVQPDIYIVQAYQNTSDFPEGTSVRAYGGQIRTIPPHQGISTSRIISRILAVYKLQSL